MFYFISLSSANFDFSELHELDSFKTDLPGEPSKDIDVQLHSFEFNLTNGFKFMGSIQYGLSYDINGRILFDERGTDVLSKCSPLDLNRTEILLFHVTNRICCGSASAGIVASLTTLQQISYEINTAFPELNNISINWAFEASFEGSINDCRNVSGQNVIRTILATDGNYSFVISIYDKIRWTNFDCKNLHGPSALAGFIAGDNINYYMYPESCTTNMMNLSQNSNVGQPGIFIYRVDSKHIQGPTHANALRP